MTILDKTNNEKEEIKVEANTTVFHLIHDILPANVYVIITDCGWRVAMFYIDYEDLWGRYIHPDLANEIVKEVVKKKDEDFTKPIYFVEIGE